MSSLMHDYYDNHVNYDAIYEDVDFEAMDYDRLSNIISERGYSWMAVSLAKIFWFRLTSGFDRSRFMKRLRLYRAKYFPAGSREYDNNPF